VFTPQVHLRTPDGRRHTLGVGAHIGRARAAELRLADAVVSEAHAMVSLRGRELVLLRLRGALRIDGQDEDEAVLVAGMRIELGPGVWLDVDAVDNADEVLAVELDGAVAQELCASVYSVPASGPLVTGYVSSALGWICSTTEGWTVQAAEGRAQPLRPGGAWDIGARRVVTTVLPVGDVATDRTVRDVTTALHITLRFSNVRLRKADGSELVLTGRLAELVCVVWDLHAPVAWDVAAGQLWRDESDVDQLRRLWDRTRRRLRLALREHAIREDLVWTDGRGNVEFLRRLGDEVVDEL
jgi:hypothetical protein